MRWGGGEGRKLDLELCEAMCVGAGDACRYSLKNKTKNAKKVQRRFITQQKASTQTQYFRNIPCTLFFPN